MTTDDELEREHIIRRQRRHALSEARALLTPPEGDPTCFDEDSSLCLEALRGAHAVITDALALNQTKETADAPR